MRLGRGRGSSVASGRLAFSTHFILLSIPKKRLLRFRESNDSIGFLALSILYILAYPKCNLDDVENACGRRSVLTQFRLLAVPKYDFCDVD